LLTRLIWCAAAIATLAALAPQPADSASRRTAASRKLAKGPQCPAMGTRALVFAKAVSGSAFLTADNVEVRLAGVLAPGDGGENPSPTQTESARGVLAAMLRAGPVTLSGDTRDRYGRVLAQVFADGAWVQGAMLRAGELRVAPDPVSAVCAKLSMAAEEEARASRAGHWRDGSFSLHTPEQLGNRAGTFEIVEGTVETASLYKGRAYINFGPDYRTDFTVTVAPEDMKAFRAARLDVKTLAGKRIRVRGWVELYNGPEMEIAIPAAIEALN